MQDRICFVGRISTHS